jgi:hypothetical protein
MNKSFIKRKVKSRGKPSALYSPVEVVHRETGVAGDLVQTLATAHCLLHHVLVGEDLIVCTTQHSNAGKQIYIHSAFLSQHSNAFSTNRLTFHNRTHSTGQAEAPESVVKDLVTLERGCGIVCDLHARSQPIKNAVATQDGVTLVADKYTGLGVAKYVVLLQLAYTTNN